MADGKRQLGDIIGDVPDWAPQERPMMAGSPATPDFSPPMRVAYGLVGLLLGVTGSLGTAIVSVNLPAIQGTLGLSPVEGAWLGNIYVITNVGMNLLLIKYRQQFGLTSFLKVFLGLYAVAGVGLLFADTFATALAFRALSGIAGASLGALAVFYMMQAFPAKLRMQGLVLGIGVSQFGMPLARVLSPDLLDLGGWHGLYALETGLALASLAAVLALRLPQGIRVVAFEVKDFVSFILLAGGLGLLAAVAALGRIEWWFDANWLGWALASSILMLTAGGIFEHYRANPLVDTRWLLTSDFVRFALAILLVRVLLSEQPVGSTGLLMALGMSAEQMRHLYVVVGIATVAGALVGAFSLVISTKLVLVQTLGCLALIAIAAFMDAHATPQTHPANLYVSQAIMGFSAAMFMGAAVMTGIGQLVQRGLGSVITFAMTIGVTQTLGGVLGASALGMFQLVRAQHHSTYLSESITATNAQTAAVLQTYGATYATTVGDPALANASGVGLLAQQVAQQANVLAYNDVFWLIFAVATLQLVLTVISTALMIRKMRANPASPSTDASAAGAAAL